MNLDDKAYKYVFYNSEDGGEIIVRFDCDCYHELVDRFKEFSLACGFQAETVASYFVDE